MSLRSHTVDTSCPWCTSTDVTVFGAATAGWLTICDNCERSYYLTNEELESA